jgi:Rrf2 family cysteine metabolism transcriptional repressor
VVVIFTTKAEYGVRLMVRLGELPGDEPVSLKTVAERERLPLAYLERIVALLRRADLVASTRGAHGGYRLARPASEIRMDEVILALEGSVAPMSCFVEDGEADRDPAGTLCSHIEDSGTGCATKLLWTRVQGGVFRALQGTTLAELVSFQSSAEPEPRVPALAVRPPAAAV